MLRRLARRIADWLFDREHAFEPLENAPVADWPINRRWRYIGQDFRPLEGMQIGDQDGTVVFPFAVSFVDALRVLFRRRVYISLLTYGNPITPFRVDAVEPDYVQNWRAFWRDAGEDFVGTESEVA